MESFIHRVKIIVNIGKSIKGIKYFVGTEEEIYEEANNYMDYLVAEFIEQRCPDNEEQQQRIIEKAYHRIEWEDENFMKMYAVIEPNVLEPVYGIYPSYEEAEEAIVSACKVWAQQVIDEQDPEDVMGYACWDEEVDFDWLVNNAIKSFIIQEVPVYGVESNE